MSIGLKRGTVKLVPHDENWSTLFEKERQILSNKFGEKILAIEHIGSTAIPGLLAKPIIDMNVAVKDLDDIDDFVIGLQELGYEYIPERRYADRQFFPKGHPDNRTHHLNLVEIDSETAWMNQLFFRDYLTKHAKEREEYAKLKEELAEQFADQREEYTERKSDFIAYILGKRKF